MFDISLKVIYVGRLELPHTAESFGHIYSGLRFHTYLVMRMTLTSFELSTKISSLLTIDQARSDISIEELRILPSFLKLHMTQKSKRNDIRG